MVALVKATEGLSRGYNPRVDVQVEYFRSSVGADIAYSRQGEGPAFVVIPPWTHHLVEGAKLGGAPQFAAALARTRTFIRYDRWGTGLSSRDRTDFSLEADVQVLSDLIDHLRLRRFALFGPSHGGPTAVLYALQHPRRVSHLVLYASPLQRPLEVNAWPAMRELIQRDWMLARKTFAALLAEGADANDIETLAQLLDISATPETTIALQDAVQGRDLAPQLTELRVPTLLVSREGDPLFRVEWNHAMAARIPRARVVTLPGNLHVHQLGDAVALASTIQRFLGDAGSESVEGLSAREAEVLGLLTEGLTNQEIAAQLALSVRTVERHTENIYAKLGVRGRAEAAAIGARIRPA